MGDLIALSKIHSLVKMNFNIVNFDDRTPLHLAALNGNSNIVRYLINDGGCKLVNSIDRWGNTPYDNALKEEFKLTCEYLKENGGMTGKELKSF